MNINPLALKTLEESNLLSHSSQDAHKRIHTQSIKHHQLQHLHLPNIINHSTVICQTSLTTALSSAKHYRYQHIAIITNPSEPRNLTDSRGFHGVL
jgi:hypothetical protein